MINLRHTLSPAFAQRGALRLSPPTRLVRVASPSHVHYPSVSVPSAPVGSGLRRPYSSGAIASDSDTLGESTRPEHAVISTFDLFSIGGELDMKS